MQERNWIRGMKKSYCQLSTEKKLNHYSYLVKQINNKCCIHVNHLFSIYFGNSLSFFFTKSISTYFNIGSGDLLDFRRACKGSKLHLFELRETKASLVLRVENIWKVLYQNGFANQKNYKTNTFFGQKMHIHSSLTSEEFFYLAYFSITVCFKLSDNNVQKCWKCTAIR